jgi:hypothetical protein
MIFNSEIGLKYAFVADFKRSRKVFYQKATLDNILREKCLKMADFYYHRRS